MSPINPTQVGLWGKPTSTLDWCERNYEVSPYVAEFWNTVSNLVMIVMGLRGLYDVCTQGLEKRFRLCFASLTIVGLGSWLFHMTLQYEMQLLDELPMLWGSCILIYCMCQIRAPIKQAENATLALTLTAIAITLSIIHLTFKIAILFFVAFGVAIVTIVILDFYYLMDQFCLKLVYFYAFGVLIQALGALLWLLDNVFCAQLDSTRKLLPSYLSPLTQLHSWWHIFVGYATYLHIIVCIWHRQTYLKRSCHIKPHLFFGYVISTQK